jgi:hypothetical protein
LIKPDGTIVVTAQLKTCQAGLAMYSAATNRPAKERKVQGENGRTIGGAGPDTIFINPEDQAGEPHLEMLAFDLVTVNVILSTLGSVRK